MILSTILGILMAAKFVVSDSNPPDPKKIDWSSLETPGTSSEYNYLKELYQNVTSFANATNSAHTAPNMSPPDLYSAKNPYYSDFLPMDHDDDGKYGYKYLKPPPPKGPNLGLILGLAIGIPLFLLFLLTVGCCFWRFTKVRRYKKQKILGSHSPSAGSEQSYQHDLENARYMEFTSCDPWAMDRTKVVVEYDKKLGSGAFCNVHKGQIKGQAAIRTVFPDLIAVQKFTDCEVAVKLLPSFADDIARSDFNQEINFMKSLNYHPHLVCMLGFVPDPRNPLLLVEYCANGDLLHLIREHRTEIEHGYENNEGLKIKNLVSFSWQISNGLQYLNSIGCIHRDVAARNVLVDAENNCKIADFGLCRLTDNLLYTARGGRLPLRWMAPESLKVFEYTFKSDVWSYGILLWELLSLGEVPYSTIDNKQLLDFIESGQRLSKPIYCPVDLYDVMKACWKQDPAMRPDFGEICDILREILEAASEDYGYLIPISTFATIDSIDEENGSEVVGVKFDDV